MLLCASLHVAQVVPVVIVSHTPVSARLLIHPDDTSTSALPQLKKFAHPISQQIHTSMICSRLVLSFQHFAQRSLVCPDQFSAQKMTGTKQRRAGFFVAHVSPRFLRSLVLVLHTSSALLRPIAHNMFLKSAGCPHFRYHFPRKKP